jgi:putative transposase
MRTLRADMEEPVTDMKNWPLVDPDEIVSDKSRNEYLERHSIMVAYFSGVSITSIMVENKIARSALYRMRKRFLRKHKDGRIFGPRALLSNERLEKSLYDPGRLHEVTPVPQGGAGLFEIFLQTFPEVRAFLEKRFLTRGAKRYRFKDTHRDMIRLAIKLGLRADQYPLNIHTRGQRALRGFRNRMIRLKPEKALNQFADHGAKMLMSTGTGENNPSLQAVYPMQRVLLDGHKLDLIAVVEILDELRGYIHCIIERPWLLLMIDERSRAVLSFKICYCTEVNSFDVLACIRKSIMPWESKVLSIPKLIYPDGAGMPSAVYDKLKWSLWSELWVDNALANVAEAVRSQVTTELGGAMCVGQSRTPVRRAVVESFFRVLTQNFSQRLPQTTGAGPGDPKRRRPEIDAIKYPLTEIELTELLEVAVATYNGTLHSSFVPEGLQVSPLEYLRLHFTKPDTLIRYLPEAKRSDFVLPSRSNKVIRGSLRSGKRPYIEFYYARYTSPEFSSCFHLVGQKVSVHFNPEDLRAIQVYLPSGEMLGVLSVQGSWRERPHDVRLRKLAWILLKKKLITFLETDDAVEVVTSYLRENAAKSRRSATRLAHANAITRSAKEEDNRVCGTNRTR